MDSVKKETTAKLASPEDIELCQGVADYLLAEAKYDMAAQFYSAGTSEALLEESIEETQGQAFDKREHLAGLIRIRKEATRGRNGPARYPGPLGLYALIRLVNGELKIKPDLPSHDGFPCVCIAALELAESAAAELADMLADKTSPGWREPGAAHPGAPETKED